MPTISQLIKRTNYLVDDVVEPSIAIDFFNEAISDLSTIGAIQKKTSIQMEKGQQTVTLPDDYVDIISVYVIDQTSEEKAKMVTERDLYDQSTEFSFRLFGNEIEIYPSMNTDYRVDIEYFSQIPKLPTVENDSSLEAIPKFDERFHRALSIYCALQYAENDDNTYKIANLRNSYREIREEMEKEYMKKKTRTRSKTINIEVGWY